MTIDTELLARVSAVLRAQGSQKGWESGLAYADLDAAREQLGLPPDAAISGGGRQRLLLSFAARPLFRFSTVISGNPSLGPLGDVLDSHSIEVAVGTNFAFSGPGADEIWPWDVVVLRTTQPFEEIAGVLREDGYEETDGLLLADRRPPGTRRYPSTFPFPSIGDGGDGVVVFGGSAAAARAALRDAGAELTEAAALLAELPGVARVASRPSSRCVVAIGLGEEADPREGELVVVVEGKAHAKRLLFNGRTSAALSKGTEVTFDQSTAEGNRATVRFRSTDELDPTRLAVETVDDPYDCP
jgi:hypothetical protein